MSAMLGFLPRVDARNVRAMNRAQAAYDRQMPPEDEKANWLDEVGYAKAIGQDEIDQILCDIADRKPYAQIVKRFELAIEKGWDSLADD